ncbi:MAG: hypothetical protein EB127_17785 [Alphaproteobacteria bacterium]|nr:hypothetical protein [Alphaproteobacteria bacterium]
MKVGDLVYFSSQHLAFDFEQLRGQYGLLLEYVEIPGRDGKTYKGWKTLWGEKKLTVWEQDISLVEPNGI